MKGFNSPSLLMSELKFQENINSPKVLVTWLAENSDMFSFNPELMLLWYHTNVTLPLLINFNKTFHQL